jgi:hypothetical protein
VFPNKSGVLAWRHLKHSTREAKFIEPQGHIQSPGFDDEVVGTPTMAGFGD